MFIRYIAQGYLTSDFSEIRLASVFCCAKIIKPFIRVYDIAENPQKAEVYLLIKNVLECLIKTAVIDPEVGILTLTLNHKFRIKITSLYLVSSEISSIFVR